MGLQTLVYQEKERACKLAIMEAIKKFESETDFNVSIATPTRKQLASGKTYLIGIDLYTVKNEK